MPIANRIAVREIKTIPPTTIDLLLAVFTVNKSAKRYRNRARSNFSKGQHGFAGHARTTKEHLYALKDKGIAEPIGKAVFPLFGFMERWGCIEAKATAFTRP